MSVLNVLDPEVAVIGGGAVAAGDLLLDPAREVLAAQGLGPPRMRVVPAHFGDESGMLGAALLALDGARVSGRLVVCPTPIGNLEDVTLRVLSALRDADVVACEDTRRTRVLLDRYGVSARLVSYHEHNEASRAAELVEQMRGGSTVALVSDAGMPLVSDPGLRAGARVRGRGRGGGGAAGAVGGAGRAGGLGAAGRPLALRGLPAAQEGGAALAARPSPAATLVAFESPRRVAASLEVLASLDPSAAGGGVPRADQGARGGRAGLGGRARRALRGVAARAARSCW